MPNTSVRLANSRHATGAQRNRGSGCSKDGLRSRGEPLGAEYAKGQIKVSAIEPTQIESEMNLDSGSRMFMLDDATGVKAPAGAIAREPGRSLVPWWPWAPITQLLRVVPLSHIKRFA